MPRIQLEYVEALSWQISLICLVKTNAKRVRIQCDKDRLVK